ncbi:MAG: ATP-dependent helicase, partial [Actinomycetes bacterium]
MPDAVDTTTRPGAPLAHTLLRPEPAVVSVPELDPHQQSVVDHRGGPLLVLAGPGTGKTTTLVEAVVDRVEGGLRPERVLVLTFTRKAALELRDRVTARLGRTTCTPSAWTFHSFCAALLTGWAGDDGFGSPPRLLTGPEQDGVVRELLLGGHADEGTVAWPESLRACLDTYGFRDEVRAVLARTREAGLDPDGLARFATETGREDWAAVARFFAEYLDVVDAQGVVDYADLVHRAVLLAEQPDVQAELRVRYPVVFVDEYQDTDPLQERLLRVLAGGGRDLVVVGDPDQSIYVFRGAEVRNILEFRHRFARLDGQPARVLTLGRSRRAGENLLAASRAVARRMALPGLPVETARAHRGLEAAASSPGRVDVHTFASSGAELDWVADQIRRAHLEGGMPWDHMAVLLRSGVRAIPVVRRVLGAAGVPVEVAGDELPLASEPAVAPLLQALAAADDPSTLDQDAARALLVSPIGGSDAGQLRRLGRLLRA